MILALLDPLAGAYSKKALCSVAANQKTGSTRKDVRMDRYLDRRSPPRMLPGDRRNCLLDHAGERTNGIHALHRTITGRGYS